MTPGELARSYPGQNYQLCVAMLMRFFSFELPNQLIFTRFVIRLLGRNRGCSPALAKNAIFTGLVSLLSSMQYALGRP
jgi:hypothetical protein